MTSYRFVLLHADWSIQHVEHEYANDFEAFQTAEALAENFDVEVSRGGSFVARIHKAHPSGGKRKLS
jgi:hypothetical protein